VICLVGCCVTWPVLIPLHVHGGMGSEQLDAITFGNVANHSWYYAHALQAWVFFGKLNAIRTFLGAH
jgi:calcium permeable stress-gated cation channel